MAGISALAAPHERGGRGLVAVGEQDDAIERIAADHLFGVHGGQVAAEHGSGAEVDLAEGDSGEFQREAAGLQDAALDGFGEGAQMAVAGVELAPGVADADERTGHIGAVVAHGGGEGAVGEAADAVFVEEGLGAVHGCGFRFWICFTTEAQRAQREICTDLRLRGEMNFTQMPVVAGKRLFWPSGHLARVVQQA